jgi:hypothetical protein
MIIATPKHINATANANLGGPGDLSLTRDSLPCRATLASVAVFVSHLVPKMRW